MHRLRDNLRAAGAVLTIAATVGLVGAIGTADAAGSLNPAAVTTSTPASTDDPAPTEAPAPAPTEAPAPAPTEAPAAPGTAAPGESDDGDSSSNLLTIVLIIAGVGIALIVIATLVSGSKSKQTPRPAGQPRANAPLPPSPQAGLLSTSQWITDQLSLELMAATPVSAVQRWSVERSRLDNVAIGAQQEFLQTGAPNWQPLSQAMSALATALDTNLGLRSQDVPNAELISESTAVVNRYRAQVSQYVAALWPTIER